MNRVIKKERVHVDESGEAPQAPLAEAPHVPGTHGPGVRLVRVDGRVQAIEVTCRCGDVSVLEIEYDEATNPTEVTS